MENILWEGVVLKYEYTNRKFRNTGENIEKYRNIGEKIENIGILVRKNRKYRNIGRNYRNIGRKKANIRLSETFFSQKNRC